MKIRVECYSGNKADERPIKFWIEDAVLFIESVEDQWSTPEARYFRVRADDGNSYLLRHEEVNDQWALEAFRSEQQGIVETDVDAPVESN